MFSCEFHLLYLLFLQKYFLHVDRLQGFTISFQLKFLPLCTKIIEQDIRNRLHFSREKHSTLDESLKAKYVFTQVVPNSYINRPNIEETNRKSTSRKTCLWSRLGLTPLSSFNIMHNLPKMHVFFLNSTYFLQVLCEYFFFSMCGVKKPI